MSLKVVFVETTIKIDIIVRRFAVYQNKRSGSACAYVCAQNVKLKQSIGKIFENPISNRK